MVVFVRLPALAATQVDQRRAFISRVFPRVFRLASVLAGVALVAGAALNYMQTGWQNMEVYLASTRGAAILTGGSLAAVLAGFHFFVEARFEGRVAQLLESADEAERTRIERLLNIVPRVGLIILLAVFILMMIGARGI